MSLRFSSGLLPQVEPRSDQDHPDPPDQQGQEDPEDNVDGQAAASSSVVGKRFPLPSKTLAVEGRT
jgi:hypothetical protein